MKSVLSPLRPGTRGLQAHGSTAQVNGYLRPWISSNNNQQLPRREIETNPSASRSLECTVPPARPRWRLKVAVTCGTHVKACEPRALNIRLEHPRAGNFALPHAGERALPAAVDRVASGQCVRARSE
ncbi:unnamed protein product [Lampetra planeri]